MVLPHLPHRISPCWVTLARKVVRKCGQVMVGTERDLMVDTVSGSLSPRCGRPRGVDHQRSAATPGGSPRCGPTDVVIVLLLRPSRCTSVCGTRLRSIGGRGAWRSRADHDSRIRHCLLRHAVHPFDRANMSGASAGCGPACRGPRGGPPLKSRAQPNVWPNEPRRSSPIRRSLAVHRPKLTPQLTGRVRRPAR